jgi:hypothetical protein
MHIHTIIPCLFGTSTIEHGPILETPNSFLQYCLRSYSLAMTITPFVDFAAFFFDSPFLMCVVNRALLIRTAFVTGRLRRSMEWFVNNDSSFENQRSAVVGLQCLSQTISHVLHDDQFIERVHTNQTQTCAKIRDPFIHVPLL